MEHERKPRQSVYGGVNFDNAWQNIRRGSQIISSAAANVTGMGEKRRSKMNIQPKASLRENEASGNPKTKVTRLNRRRSKKPVEETASPASTKETPQSIAEEDNLSLYDKMDSKLFKSDLTSKKFADIVRTAHTISVECLNERGEKEEIATCEEITEEDCPDRQKREMQRMILVIERLLRYFGKNSCEDDLIKYCYEFCDAYDDDSFDKSILNLHYLFKQLQSAYATPEQSLLVLKVRQVLKFLHISVIIFSIEEMRKQLTLGLDHITKDMKDGWKIKIVLDERFLEVSHFRKECVLKQKGEHNYWEISYSVTTSFDPSMRHFSAVRLMLNELHLHQDMDNALAQELRNKFYDGKYIVC